MAVSSVANEHEKLMCRRWLMQLFPVESGLDDPEADVVEDIALEDEEIPHEESSDLGHEDADEDDDEEEEEDEEEAEEIAAGIETLIVDKVLTIVRDLGAFGRRKGFRQFLLLIRDNPTSFVSQNASDGQPYSALPVFRC